MPPTAAEQTETTAARRSSTPLERCPQSDFLWQIALESHPVAAPLLTQPSAANPLRPPPLPSFPKVFDRHKAATAPEMSDANMRTPIAPTRSLPAPPPTPPRMPNPGSTANARQPVGGGAG